MDVNVALDSLLAREPWRADADAVWAACDAGHAAGHLAAITVTSVFYLVEKSAPKGKAADAVDACLKAFTIVPVGRDTLLAARSMTGNDFEDNVQIACSTAVGAGAIVTRNPGDFLHSPIPVMSPQELLAALASQP